MLRDIHAANAHRASPLPPIMARLDQPEAVRLLNSIPATVNTSGPAVKRTLTPVLLGSLTPPVTPSNEDKAPSSPLPRYWFPDLALEQSAARIGQGLAPQSPSPPAPVQDGTTPTSPRTYTLPTTMSGSDIPADGSSLPYPSPNKRRRLSEYLGPPSPVGRAWRVIKPAPRDLAIDEDCSVLQQILKRHGAPVEGVVLARPKSSYASSRLAFLLAQAPRTGRERDSATMTSTSRKRSIDEVEAPSTSNPAAASVTSADIHRPIAGSRRVQAAMPGGFADGSPEPVQVTPEQAFWDRCDRRSGTGC